MLITKCIFLYCRYNIVFFFLTYVMPIIGMGVCYIQMGRHLWHGDKSALTLLMSQVLSTVQWTLTFLIYILGSIGQEQEWQEENCQNVCLCGGHFHGVLGPIPHLFYILLPLPIHHPDILYWSYLPLLLLAGNVQHMCQSYYLLLHEPEISNLLQTSSLLCTKLHL